jgi:putative DNA primase/helicase
VGKIVELSKLQESSGLPPQAEDSLALAFADQHAGELRYVARWGQWLSYDGACWRRDDTLHVFDRVRSLCRESAAGSGRVASAKTVAAVERLARSDRRLAATTDQWDAGPAKLVDGTATFNLCEGTNGPLNPLDYITKKTACAAAPCGTPHPIWTAFLAKVTADNAELQRFLQRYVGYCLTGFTGEHVFVFAYGTGANGKSTFLNTVAKVFGDYATTAAMDTFLASNSERHPTELAKLHGARLVVAQETEKGRRWDEIKLKALTGGDRIAARYMRQDYFDFAPAFKLFIVGNTKPRLNNVDEAMRRRLLLVPFSVQIPAHERDPTLPEKLEAEWPAILRWCIDGAFAWHHTGLDPPACVREASDAYFSEQDTVQQWLDDCTHDGGSAAFTRVSELFASWKTWCEEHNFRPGTTRALSDALVDKGFMRHREHGRYRGFMRLAVKKA